MFSNGWSPIDGVSVSGGKSAIVYMLTLTAYHGKRFVRIRACIWLDCLLAVVARKTVASLLFCVLGASPMLRRDCVLPCQVLTVLCLLGTDHIAAPYFVPCL